MAGEERDARLILRAEDRASRTFDQVAGSIKNVRKAIADQSKAAQEGTGDLAAMQRQLQELKEAGDDLIQGQSLIKQFQGVEEQVGRAEERLRSATKALADYRAKVGENPTDAQQNQIDKKSGAVDRAQGNLDRQNERLATLSARLQKAGIDSDNLDREFMRIAASAVEAAQGIAQVKGQIDDYPAALQRAKDAMEDLRAEQALAGRDTSFLKPGEFDFIQSLDGAKAKLAALVELEGLEARSAATAAAAERQRRAEQKAALDDVLRGNEALDAQFKELIATEQRLKDLDAFRQTGTDAAEAVVKTERYAASVQALGNDFQSFSQSVRTALGGTQSGLQDIGQALQQIDASAAVLDQPKAKINALSESSGKLAIAIATLDRTARQIDGFRAQQQAVQASEAAFAEAQQEALRLAEAVRTAEAPSEALAAELRQAERALDAAGKAMQRDRNEAVRLGDALRKAGIDTNNLEQEMQRLQNGANRAGAAAQGFQGKLRGRGGFLGLNAFELQNLGYQVNDVFTQLGSGTPILQVLAQQGPQIIQLFQGLGTTLLRFAPLIAGALVLLSPFIDALFQSARATEQLRAAQTLLAGTPGVSPETVRQYQQAGIELRNMGASAADTTKALTSFRNSGLDPSGLAAFTQALIDANRGGADMAQTSELLSEALSGNVKSVEALNDQFHFLTPAEEDQIAKMIESGNESEARRLLFEKFSATAERQANAARGPWSKAWDDLTDAFHRFTAMISNSAPFRALNSFLNTIGENIRQRIDDLTYFFNYASKRGFFGAVSDAFTGRAAPGSATANAQNEAAAFANRRGRAVEFGAGGGGGPNVRDTLEGARAVRTLTDAYEEQRRGLKQLTRAETEAEARRKARRTAVGSDAQRQQQEDLAARIALAKFDDDAAKAAERAGKKRQTAANRAARAAETLANQRRQIEEALVRDLDGLESQVGRSQIQSIEQRRQAVLDQYTSIFQKIDEAKRKGVTRVGDQSLAEYEATVRAQIAILQNNAEQKAREDQINETIKQRADELKNIQDQLDRGDLTPAEAMARFEETISRFAPQVTQMTNDALAFARGLRTATPNPALEAFIARLERIQQQNSGGQDRTLLKGLDQKVIADEGKKLDELIQQRDAYAQAENNLVALGLRTRQEAQANIEAAYARTNPLIAAQIEQMRTLLGTFVAANPEMQTFYDTWIAKLDGVAAQSQYVDARFTQLKSGFDNLITQNAVDAIDNIAKSFANLALGQQNAVDTLLQVGAAFLNFIAQTIIGIAKLILQMLILDAVQKITGIPVGALLKFMNATGLHTGGVVGQERTFSRQVPSLAFANAPRYHGGGVAGFAPDEVPAILKRNEEVLEETDPRHRFNLGKGDGPEEAGSDTGGLRQVLVLDPSELASALAGPAGEKVVMTHLRRNKTTLKQLAGD